MNHPLIFEPMEVHDIDAVVALIHAAMNPQESQWARKTLISHFDSRKHQVEDGRSFLVWRKEGTISGIVGLHHYLWGPPENVWLGWFAVKPESQGKGIGLRLLREVEHLAAARGYRKLFVETYDHPDFEKARAFYENQGFEQTGEIQDYLAEGASMVVYSKPLSLK